MPASTPCSSHFHHYSNYCSPDSRLHCLPTRLPRGPRCSSSCACGSCARSPAPLPRHDQLQTPPPLHSTAVGFHCPPSSSRGLLLLFLLLLLLHSPTVSLVVFVAVVVVLRSSSDARTKWALAVGCCAAASQRLSHSRPTETIKSNSSTFKIPQSLTCTALCLRLLLHQIFYYSHIAPHSGDHYQHHCPLHHHRRH